MLGYWLYLSESVTPPRSIDDALIYLQARNRNPAHRITGYLHREERHYAQYVEGPLEELDRLRGLILNDGRHRNVQTLASGMLESRRFGDWDMAFSTAETVSFRLFQRRWDRQENLTLAPADEILEFMEHTARRQKADAVAKGRPPGDRAA